MQVMRRMEPGVEVEAITAAVKSTRENSRRERNRNRFRFRFRLRVWACGRVGVKLVSDGIRIQVEKWLKEWWLFGTLVRW